MRRLYCKSSGERPGGKHVLPPGFVAPEVIGRYGSHDGATLIADDIGSISVKWSSPVMMPFRHPQQSGSPKLAWRYWHGYRPGQCAAGSGAFENRPPAS